MRDQVTFDEELLYRDMQLEEAADQENISRHTIRSLQEALVATTGIRDDPSIPIPDHFGALPEWVDTYLDGRLILYYKARNEIKDAEYHKPVLVYQALLLLAGPYRNMRLGMEGEKAKWDAGLSVLHLECSRSISPERVGEHWDEYHIAYPDGQKYRFLEHHLKKGVSKDKRFCLRIYFFWDEERKVVVVGSLPHHLRTDKT